VVWENEKSVRLFGASVGKSLIEATRLYDLETLVANTFHATEPMERRVTLNGSTYLAARRCWAGETWCWPCRTLARCNDWAAPGAILSQHQPRVADTLASIRLLVETLQAGALSNPPVASEMLSKINIEMDALSQLARELLDLALIESGQMPLKLQRTDLHDLAQTQMQRFTPQAQPKQQTLDVDIPAGMCALADGEMIGRVLSNLLHNACKFTPSGGRISVSAQLDQDDVTVSVTDTGPGIPPKT